MLTPARTTRMVARGRKASEALMVDECSITRITGETVGVGGAITATTGEVYAGKCRVVLRRGTTGRAVEVGEAYRIAARRVLQLPATATDVEEGDTVTITSAYYDPGLAGRTFTVRTVDASSLNLRREVEIIEVTS